jgi:hypothetical protein
MTDTQQIIKAAVQAIEDVKNQNYWYGDIDNDYCLHRRSKHELCQYCINEKLKPHLEALKGRIDG